MATIAAARWRLQDAATPQEVPGWDELAAGRSFYTSADWLRFADTDRVARSRYLGMSAGGRLVAALSSHWAREEVDDGYVAARTLEMPAGVPIGDGVLTLGGRRGFLSGVLVAPDLDRSAAADYLATLIDRAVAAGPAPGAAWWWPYLLCSDVDVVVAAWARLGGTASAGVHLVGADYVMDVVGTTIDDYVAALPTRLRRANFRREDRRFTDSGLEIRRIELSDYWAQLGPLLAALQQKYGHRPSADAVAAALRRHAEHMGSRAVVFGCFDHDVVVGFALVNQWGDELALRALGFDYERLLGVDEYAQLAMHAPLRHCYEQGLHRLNLGIESDEAKIRRGARPRPVWAVTSLPGADSDSLARTVGRLTASMPAPETESFTTQVAQSWQRWQGLGS